MSSRAFGCMNMIARDPARALLTPARVFVFAVPLSCGSGGGGTSPITAGGALPPSLCASAYVRSHAHLLNGEQLEAVQRVLAMNDYAVLLGMPGTGKTTTIVHIIRVGA